MSSNVGLILETLATSQRAARFRSGAFGGSMERASPILFWKEFVRSGCCIPRVHQKRTESQNRKKIPAHRAVTRQGSLGSLRQFRCHLGREVQSCSTN